MCDNQGSKVWEDPPLKIKFSDKVYGRNDDIIKNTIRCHVEVHSDLEFDPSDELIRLTDLYTMYINIDMLERLKEYLGNVEKYNYFIGIFEYSQISLCKNNQKRNISKSWCNQNIKGTALTNKESIYFLQSAIKYIKNLQ